MSSRPLWQHWVTVCVPDKITQSVGLMYMDGPRNTPTPDASLNPEIDMICSGNLGAPVVYLQQIPNEDLSFPDYPSPLGEDALIAYGWRKFLNGSAVDPTWLLRLPMTRAGTNCMTAVQDYMKRAHPDQLQPTSFVVAGASKRGWTTWTVAAVDTRVAAAVPIVMPIPDVVPNIAAEWRAYGNWSFALKDYVHFGIVNYLFTNPDGIQAIADITGPLPYIKRLTMPVWNIIACGDEFTLPDSPRFWWNDLPGEKHLRAVPNAEHSMACCALDLVSDIMAFYQLLVHKVERPKLSWTLDHAGVDGTARITVNSSIVPASAKMWWATTIPSSGKRDFRLVICWQLPECVQPVAWFPRDLKNLSPDNTTGMYVAEQVSPAAGWTGFLIQLDFKMDVPGLSQPVYFRESTEVNIVPDIFPFATCPESECNNPGKTR